MARGFVSAAVLAVATMLALPVPAGSDEPAPDLAELAACIEASGAVFYGAHWCPFCRKQMAYFEEHAGLLPYVECYAGAKSEGMRPECRDQGVRSFPTWRFPDGTVATGAKTPDALARATGCL